MNKIKNIIDNYQILDFSDLIVNKESIIAKCEILKYEEHEIISYLIKLEKEFNELKLTPDKSVENVDDLFKTNTCIPNSNIVMFTAHTPFNNIHVGVSTQEKQCTIYEFGREIIGIKHLVTFYVKLKAE
jgi:hypothetical protein